jgi:phosphoglycolate phosphatase-like HAD superfamily hydrolase
VFYLHKPYVEGININIFYYQVNFSAADQAFLVGDSFTDIETARNAGIKVVVLVNGEDKTERLLPHKPDHLINNLTELEEIFRNYSRSQAEAV